MVIPAHPYPAALALLEEAGIGLVVLVLVAAAALGVRARLRLHGAGWVIGAGDGADDFADPLGVA